MQLMNVYGDYLLRTAVLLVNDHQTAEELVQDTFIIAFEKINQLEDVTKMKGWLTAIIINACRAKMRKWSWKNIFPRMDIVNHAEKGDSTDDPEEIVLQLFQHQHLSELIQQLDYKYREVITLFYFNDMKINDISKQIKINENTVKSRLTRGRVLLKALLEKGEVNYERTEQKNKQTAP
ncbi:sigma-70 family RNA polymerase sigma factor [Virgibacillus soli]|uniref:Sigma-70 family RNA polymerase sigma factor n=1 Tax=Paracerasibacillus soli TaxID=480284 RepID=A0ABU5CVD7_9BACI|nr:sigma-70 family RNA polymerase sigma factor [Virgibacillus soli]MDY0410281.1 sigma-70 family RNA polymerase sigma factor [Virgibacillus soli]